MLLRLPLQLLRQILWVSRVWDFALFRVHHGTATILEATANMSIQALIRRILMLFFFFRMHTVVVTMLNFIIIVVSMVILFYTVRRTEKRAAKWSHTAAQGNAQKKVIYKAILLMGVFILVYLPSFSSYWLETYFIQVYSLVLALTIPCQGFFNALIYSDKLIQLARTSSKFSFSGLMKRMSGKSKKSSKLSAFDRNSTTKTNNLSTISSTIGGISVLSLALNDKADEGNANLNALNGADESKDNPNPDPSIEQLALEEENLVESGLKHQENTIDSPNPSVTLALEKDQVESGLAEEEAVDS